MIRHRFLLFVLLWITVGAPCAVAGTGPGEFEVRATVPLDAAQRDRLRGLVAADPEAAALFQKLKAEAEARMDLQPQPLRVIRYEGLVNTDPGRVADVEKLGEMNDVAILLQFWQATGDERAAAALRRFILAWSGTYAPTGNDVNENKLYPLFVASEALLATFTPDERPRIERWLARLGELHAAAVRDSRHFTNRYTKHVRLLALFGRTLGRNDWRRAADDGFKRFVAESLRADGGSRDLELRDTLTYHNSALRPLVELAIIAGPAGRELYSWQSPAGGSLKKSVDYVVPFASGEKTRREWLHTQVDLDRRRAAAGLEEYRPGRLFEPRDALRLIEEAGFFDPELVPLALKLHQSPCVRFASWTMVVNAAAR